MNGDIKIKNTDIWQCRIAPSLGQGFEGTPETAWGVKPYYGFNDLPCVFFGLYGLPDFYTFWRHNGPKAVLWAGSDIRNFLNGYWLDDKGEIRLDPLAMAQWINQNCESYVENRVEQEALHNIGVHSLIVPSFLGKVDKFPVAYTYTGKIKLYTTVSGNDFKLYGWDKIPELANINPDVEFHLYGNTIFPFMDQAYPDNIVIHGRVSKQEMNAETRMMTGALRLTEFDGFSEIIAKSLLWGQWPVSLIEYPHTLQPRNIDMLQLAKEPNHEGREWLLSVVNKYPWNQKV